MTLTNCYALQLVAQAVAAMQEAREGLLRMVDNEAEVSRRAGLEIERADVDARKALLLRYLEHFTRACELEVGLAAVDAGAFEREEWRSAMGAELPPEERSGVVGSSTTRTAETPRDVARVMLEGPTPAISEPTN